MAWIWIGDKLLSEPMLTRFTDAYMRRQGEMTSWTSWIIACWLVISYNIYFVSRPWVGKSIRLYECDTFVAIYFNYPDCRRTIMEPCNLLGCHLMCRQTVKAYLLWLHATETTLLWPSMWILYFCKSVIFHAIYFFVSVEYHISTRVGRQQR